MSCLSVTLVYCGQTLGWIKMPLGTEMGLGPWDTVLDGDPAPLPTESGTCLLWLNGRPSQLLSYCSRLGSVLLSFLQYSDPVRWVTEMASGP